MMNNNRITFFLLIILLITLCARQEVVSQSIIQKKNDIDKYLNHIMERHQIPGITLAIIKDGKVIHKENYGKANIEHNVPITDKSIFRLYSLTKPIIAVGIFQLIEQNRLSLDDAVSKYIKDLPDAWNAVQIKHLLSHSSGFPNMAPVPKYQSLTEGEAKEMVFKEAVRFTPGEKYDYNQTNFWLLQRIIEKVTSEKLEDYILQNQFGQEGKGKGVFFSSDSRDIVANRVTPYFPFATGKRLIDHSYLQGKYFYAANGLNITLNEFIKWDDKLNRNELIRKASKDKMWETFEYNNKRKKFTHGWDQHKVGKHVSYGFSGSFVTAYRNFPKDNMSVIFLSNGLGYWYNIENIINHIVSIVDQDIIDIDNFIFELLLQASLEEHSNRFKSAYTSLKNADKYHEVNFELQINYVGYMLINLEKIDKALAVFQMNTREHPSSWNAFDSLGEAQEKSGDIINAMESYRKALSLNSQNKNDYNVKLEKKITALSHR